MSHVKSFSLAAAIALCIYDEQCPPAMTISFAGSSKAMHIG
jgi:hypothetical protein